MRAVILLGGPNKGTRFRPLSLDIPKPLFPVGGIPILQQQVEQCIAAGCDQIFLLGFYPVDEIDPFIREFKNKNVNLRYLFEYEPLSTAGGLFHYRDQITRGLTDSDSFLLLNSDVCSLYPLKEMMKIHNESGKIATILCVKSEDDSANHYGCLHIRGDKNFGVVEHYVEKPESFVSSTISCGIYIFNVQIIQNLKTRFHSMAVGETAMSLEREILPELANQEELFGLVSSDPFVQIKSAASAVSASDFYLGNWRKNDAENLANGKNIIGDVFIHPSAKVDENAVIGPNVAIGPRAKIEKGTRIRNAIVLDDVTIQEHSIVIDAIIGWASVVGKWCRIEGTPPVVNPDAPYSRIESDRLFDGSGRLIPSSTVLGRGVCVGDEEVVRNCIVMPSKNINYSIKNQIVL